MTLIIPTREATKARTKLIIPDRKPLEFTNADIRKEKGKSIINGMIESGQATTAREPITIPSRKPSLLQAAGEYVSPQPDKVRVVDFVRELGGLFGKITSGAKFIQEEISRSGASVGLTVSGATSGGAKELDISGDEIENKFARVIFGDRPLKSIESRVADAELVLKNYSEKVQRDTGADRASELQKSLGEIGEANSTLLSFIGVAGMISLDFTGAGGEKNAIKALANSKDFAFISKILRQIGVAEDIITPTASKLVKVSDEKIISKAITKIDDLQKSTNIVKNSLKIPERIKTGNIQINKIKLGDDFADATGDIQKGIKSKTDLPVLLGKEGDEFFVKDGNHRIAEAMKRGENTIKATLDEAEYLKLTKEKKISSLDDIFEVKKTVKPKPLTGKEQIALREEAKFARMEEKAQRESLSFEGELESQYQSFKKLISPSKLDEIADATQLKAKVKANSEEIDNILYSQDKNIDEVFDMFKERRFDETAPFTQIPKETKAVVAEKARQQVKSAKDIIDRRRGFINAAKRHFGLSDTDLKKITRKDIRLMSNIEFKKFIDDLRIGAAKLAKTREAKNRVLNLVKEKELQKVDALRKAMKLPPINKMSIEELGKLEKELEKAQVGDVFLTTRELETVKKTDLGDIKTIREARVKLAKELGVPVSSLDNIKVSELDRLRFDTALADRNPFYKMLVENTHENILIGEKSFLETETEINKLVTKARKSRKRGIGEKLIPTDKKVFDYLSGNEKLAKEMTSEELELANYLQVKFSDALDYLLKNEVIEKGRSNYITNTRRGFLEAVKEDGIIKSIREVLDAHKQDEQTFQILDRSTGDILPLEKFFQFSLRRTGGIKPTKNVAKAANTYFRTLEKKKALDALIPKMDIYVRSLTPTKLTPKGLEMDRKLKTFVNEWLNNKKGRKTTLIAKQGGKIDIALSTIRSFLYFKDLAFSLPVGLASFVGEQVSTFVNIGNRLYLKGVKRSLTKQGKSIIDKYTNFIGKSVWSELKEPSKNIGDKFTEGMFGAFAQSTREANKIHLLANLTEAEFKAGAVSPKRLAQMKIEIGKFRMLSEGKSIVGSTPEGQVMTQYKTWAIPILRTITKDLSTILKTISKGDIKKAITSTEMKEILRAAEISSGVLFLGNKFIDEDDESFMGKMTKRLQQEALTILGALDTKTMLAAPRLTSFVENLGKALSSLIKLEEYKTKKGLVGVGKLKRELKPGFVRQFETKKTASPRAAELKKIFNSGGSQRKTLNEIFK